MFLEGLRSSKAVPALLVALAPPLLCLSEYWYDMDEKHDFHVIELL